MYMLYAYQIYVYMFLQVQLYFYKLSCIYMLPKQ